MTEKQDKIQYSVALAPKGRGEASFAVTKGPNCLLVAKPAPESPAAQYPVAGWAFACWLRHKSSVPRSRDWGFTPALRCQGQRVLDILPRSTHELPVLIAAPDRSGLRSSFPAQPIRCLRLSALECLTSLADGRAYYALC